MQLPPGFTAIVGPNGTGKSNLADAVRWALSTGRASDGRLAHRDDVLFAGSQGRRAASMCEVRLTFDNQDRRLPIDAAEVEIVRRIYRGGEGEYRLQGAQCRARDIERLLAELGLAEGYAWIGQGRVEEVVEQDPAARRRLLEDAAGASVYRERRREAILELARADQEAEVERARAAEITQRLPELRRLAEQAVVAADLRALIRQIEIGLARRRIERVSQSLTRASERRRDVEESRGRGTAVLEREEELERSIRSLQESLAGLLGRAERQMAAMDGRAQAAVAEEAGAAERERSALARHEEARTRLAGAEQVRRGLQAELSDASLRLSTAEETLRRAGERGASALRALARMPQLEEALRTNGEELRQAQQNLAQIQGRHQERALRLADLAAAAQAAAQVLDGASAQLQAARREERELSAARDAVEARATELSELRRAADRALPQAVRALLEAARAGTLEGVLGTLGQLVAPADGRVGLALATALGGQAADLVVADGEVARRAIAWLRESRAGRATFLPLGALDVAPPPKAPASPGCLGLLVDFVRYPDAVAMAVRFRLGRTLLAEGIESAQEVAAATGRRLRVVTLDGQVVQVGGALTGGQAVSLLPQSPPEAQWQRTQDELRQIDERWRSAHAWLGRAAEEERRAREAAESAAQPAETARAQFLAAERDLAVAQALVAEGEAVRGRLLADIAASRAAVPSEAGAALQEASLQRALLQEEVSRLAAAIARADEDEARARAVLSAAQEALEAAAGEAARRKTLRQASVAWRDVLAAQRQRVQRLQRLLLVQERLLERAAREVATRTAGAQEQALQLTGEIERLAQELSQQRHGLAAAHGQASLEQAAPALPGGAEEKLLQARRELQEIGGVDPDAGRRLRAEEERLGEVAERLADIAGAKAALVEVLAMADREVDERYRAAVRTVGEAFAGVARTLFGDSVQARLAPVADGVEIEVRLPGKDAVRMAWLSGGERALMALAFLFALGELCPPPFYLLDEVEAALDERNVERFASFLRDQRGRQLVVMTHQRPTMEAAEQLIGTTMQVQGITRLAAVWLGEVESRGDLGEMA